MDKLHKVAQFLFVNEKMSGEEFQKIMEAEKPLFEDNNNLFDQPL